MVLNRVMIEREPKNCRLKWLVVQQCCVFFVLLCCKTLQHFVCVEANAKEILDLVEKDPLGLCVEILLRCVGDPIMLDTVAEIRRMVHTRESKRKNNLNPLGKGREEDVQDKNADECCLCSNSGSGPFVIDSFKCLTAWD